jgi:hypothetical protein
LRASLSHRARGPTAITGSSVPPVLNVVRTLVLVVALFTIPLAHPRLGAGGSGKALAVALVVTAVGYVGWLVLGRRSERLTVAALAVLGAAGGVLAGLSPLSTAVAVGCVVTSAAGVTLSTEASLAITAETVAALGPVEEAWQVCLRIPA